jgi:hypothetical protein
MGAPYLARFGEMWDSTALTLKLFTPNQQLRSTSLWAKSEERMATGHILGIWVVSQPPPRALIKSTLASIRRWRMFSSFC